MHMCVCVCACTYGINIINDDLAQISTFYECQLGCSDFLCFQGTEIGVSGSNTNGGG